MNSYTCKITADQAKALKASLEEKGFEPFAVSYASFAGRQKDLNVVCYQTGKVVVQGKGTRDFVEFTLEPEILKQARLGYEETLNPELLLPRLGVDESGKGDFFGPLCIAGVYVNEKVLRHWKESGIRDSKNISSDKRMAELADLIQKTEGCVTSVVTIGNEAYNRLYAKMRSVNRVLAWGHARAIENLMAQKHRMNPPPVRAISDQFAADKGVVAGALMSLGREIELVQRHKAEEDTAVAAASILARDQFVSRLRVLGKEFGMTFPKGASSLVDVAAKDFVQRFGAEKLKLVSKVHFRTAFRAQGLPEPVSTWTRTKTETPSAGMENDKKM